MIPNITSKEDFYKLSIPERAGLLKSLNLTQKYFQDRHKKRRELSVSQGNISLGISGQNKKMLDFIAEEVVLYIKKLRPTNTKRKVA